jgi:hypothetical protein
MIAIAIAMFIAARPRNGIVVSWLRSDNLQWAYTMMIVLLLGVESAIALAS